MVLYSFMRCVCVLGFSLVGVRGGEHDGFSQIALGGSEMVQKKLTVGDLEGGLSLRNPSKLGGFDIVISLRDADWPDLAMASEGHFDEDYSAFSGNEQNERLGLQMLIFRGVGAKERNITWVYFVVIPLDATLRKKIYAQDVKKTLLCEGLLVHYMRVSSTLSFVLSASFVKRVRNLHKVDELHIFVVSSEDLRPSVTLAYPPSAEIPIKCEAKVGHGTVCVPTATKGAVGSTQRYVFDNSDELFNTADIPKISLVIKLSEHYDPTKIGIAASWDCNPISQATGCTSALDFVPVGMTMLIGRPKPYVKIGKILHILTAMDLTACHTKSSTACDTELILKNPKAKELFRKDIWEGFYLPAGDETFLEFYLATKSSQTADTLPKIYGTLFKDNPPPLDVSIFASLDTALRIGIASASSASKFHNNEWEEGRLAWHFNGVPSGQAFTIEGNDPLRQQYPAGWYTMRLKNSGSRDSVFQLSVSFNAAILETWRWVNLAFNETTILPKDIYIINKNTATDYSYPDEATPQDIGEEKSETAIIPHIEPKARFDSSVYTTVRFATGGVLSDIHLLFKGRKQQRKNICIVSCGLRKGRDSEPVGPCTNMPYDTSVCAVKYKPKPIEFEDSTQDEINISKNKIHKFTIYAVRILFTHITDKSHPGLPTGITLSDDNVDYIPGKAIRLFNNLPFSNKLQENKPQEYIFYVEEQITADPEKDRLFRLTVSLTSEGCSVSGKLEAVGESRDVAAGDGVEVRLEANLSKWRQFESAFYYAALGSSSLSGGGEPILGLPKADFEGFYHPINLSVSRVGEDSDDVCDVTVRMKFQEALGLDAEPTSCLDSAIHLQNGVPFAVDLVAAGEGELGRLRTIGNEEKNERGRFWHTMIDKKQIQLFFFPLPLSGGVRRIQFSLSGRPNAVGLCVNLMDVSAIQEYQFPSMSGGNCVWPKSPRSGRGRYDVKKSLTLRLNNEDQLFESSEFAGDEDSNNADMKDAVQYRKEKIFVITTEADFEKDSNFEIIVSTNPLYTILPLNQPFTFSLARKHSKLFRFTFTGPKSDIHLFISGMTQLDVHFDYERHANSPDTYSRRVSEPSEMIIYANDLLLVKYCPNDAKRPCEIYLEITAYLDTDITLEAQLAPNGKLQISPSTPISVEFQPNQTRIFYMTPVPTGTLTFRLDQGDIQVLGKFDSKQNVAQTTKLTQKQPCFSFNPTISVYQIPKLIPASKDTPACKTNQDCALLISVYSKKKGRVEFQVIEDASHPTYVLPDGVPVKVSLNSEVNAWYLYNMSALRLHRWKQKDSYFIISISSVAGCLPSILVTNPHTVSVRYQWPEARTIPLPFKPSSVEGIYAIQPTSDRAGVCSMELLAYVASPLSGAAGVIHLELARPLLLSVPGQMPLYLSVRSPSLEDDQKLTLQLSATNIPICAHYTPLHDVGDVLPHREGDKWISDTELTPLVSEDPTNSGPIRINLGGGWTNSQRRLRSIIRVWEYLSLRSQKGPIEIALGQEDGEILATWEGVTRNLHQHMEPKKVDNILQQKNEEMSKITKQIEQVAGSNPTTKVVRKLESSSDMSNYAQFVRNGKRFFNGPLCTSEEKKKFAKIEEYTCEGIITVLPCTPTLKDVQLTAQLWDWNAEHFTALPIGIGHVVDAYSDPTADLSYYFTVFSPNPTSNIVMEIHTVTPDLLYSSMIAIQANIINLHNTGNHTICKASKHSERPCWQSQPSTSSGTGEFLSIPIPHEELPATFKGFFFIGIRLKRPMKDGENLHILVTMENSVNFLREADYPSYYQLDPGTSMEFGYESDGSAGYVVYTAHIEWSTSLSAASREDVKMDYLKTYKHVMNGLSLGSQDCSPRVPGMHAFSSSPILTSFGHANERDDIVLVTLAGSETRGRCFHRLIMRSELEFPISFSMTLNTSVVQSSSVLRLHRPLTGTLNSIDAQGDRKPTHVYRILKQPLKSAEDKQHETEKRNSSYYFVRFEVCKGTAVFRYGPNQADVSSSPSLTNAFGSHPNLAIHSSEVNFLSVTLDRFCSPNVTCAPGDRETGVSKNTFFTLSATPLTDAIVLAPIDTAELQIQYMHDPLAVKWQYNSETRKVRLSWPDVAVANAQDVLHFKDSENNKDKPWKKQVDVNFIKSEKLRETDREAIWARAKFGDFIFEIFYAPAKTLTAHWDTTCGPYLDFSEKGRTHTNNISVTYNTRYVTIPDLKIGKAYRFTVLAKYLPGEHKTISAQPFVVGHTELFVKAADESGGAPSVGNYGASTTTFYVMIFDATLVIIALLYMLRLLYKLTLHSVKRSMYSPTEIDITHLHSNLHQGLRNKKKNSPLGTYQYYQDSDSPDEMYSPLPPQTLGQPSEEF